MKTHSVTWYLHPDQDLFFSSKLLTGLCRLARSGVLDLKLRNFGPLPQRKPPVFLWEVTRLQDGARRRVVLDVLDSPVRFNDAAMADADVYFKRSYVSDVIRSTYPQSLTKLRPMGLVHSCLSREAVTRHVEMVTRVVGDTIKAKGSLPGKVELARLTAGLGLIKGLPPPDEFVLPPGEARDHRVIFQTRVWPPEESADDLDAVNRERIDLVKALRAGLGERFVGGIMSDDYSRRICPEVLAKDNIYRGAYVRFARRFAVGVYSRGIHHSLAFKLSEYLAAGLCIVSSAFVHELPVPLEPGKHYLPYDTFDECARQCQLLLNDNALAQRMSAANLEYYQRWVEPAAHVNDLLRRTFEGSQ